jgi:hypothetical protein
VANGFGEAALGWWASLVEARAARARADAGAAPTRDPAAGATGHPLGTRLTAPPEPLTLLTRVRPGTLAVLLRPGRPAELRQPGSVLVPPVLARPTAPVQVQVLSTAPVHLDVSVTDLVSLDGYPLEAVGLRLRLQLDAGDPAARARLATQHGAELEPVLLGHVQREVVAAVRGAVAVNRRADLHRLGTRRVLEDRWLPTSFAEGILLCRDATVLGASQGDPEDEQTLVLPAVSARPAPSADPQPAAATDEATPMAAS